MKITFRPIKFIAFYCARNTSHNIFPSFRCHYFSACIIFTQFRCAMVCAYNDKVLNLFPYVQYAVVHMHGTHPSPIPFCLISNGVCYVPEFTIGTCKPLGISYMYPASPSKISHLFKESMLLDFFINFYIVSAKWITTRMQPWTHILYGFV